jgi:hypothetical protein
MRTKLFLICLLAGCASSPKVEDVLDMSRENNTRGLVGAYDRADSDTVRIAILEQLAEHPDDQSGRDLVLKQARTASTEPVKLAALKASARYEGDDVIDTMLAALDDPWPAVREQAQSLLSARAPAAQSKLQTQLSGSLSPLVRAACVRLLEGVARMNAAAKTTLTPLLLEATKDEAPKVREAAALALGTLNVASARSQLVALMRTDPDAGVRMTAERSITKLGDQATSGAIVAVLPLKNDTGLADPDIERFGRQLAEYVAARLASGKVCEVIDPAKVEQAITELKKVGEAMYDGDSPNAPLIGRFKIANQLVYGTLQRQGSTFTIVLNRMEIATLAQVPGAAVTVQGFRPDLETLKVRAADQLLASFR